MSRKDDVPAGARQMPDFDKLAEICRKPIEDTRPLEPSDLIVKQAFSVKWIWGWLEMHGYKTTEYRSSPPRYRLRGRCTSKVRELYPAKLLKRSRGVGQTLWGYRTGAGGVWARMAWNRESLPASSAVPKIYFPG